MKQKVADFEQLVPLFGQKVPPSEQKVPTPIKFSLPKQTHPRPQTNSRRTSGEKINSLNRKRQKGFFKVGSPENPLNFFEEREINKLYGQTTLVLPRVGRIQYFSVRDFSFDNWLNILAL